MLNFLTEVVNHYGFPGMFLLVWIENMGVPFPTEPAYFVGENLIKAGQRNYYAVLGILTAGHLLGAFLSYFAGRRIGRGLKKGKELSEVQQKVAHWYKKYGNITVFATRSIGYVRPWSSYVAGIAEVKFWPFAILTILGTLLFNVVTLAITDKLVYLWEHYTSIRILILASFSFGFLFLFLIGHGKKKKKK